MVGARARVDGDRVAIRAPGNAALTYADLDDAINRFAGALGAMGFSRQDRIALVVPNGAEAAVAFLGIAATCACAPLNPAYRENELAGLLSSLRAVAVVVATPDRSAATSTAQRLGLRVLPLRCVEPTRAGRCAIDVAGSGGRGTARATSDDVALLLNTSGTTTRPKTVPLTHANLVHSAHNIARTLALEAGDCCLNVMPLFHIHGLVGALLSSLSAGASIACCPGFSAGDFFAWMDEIQPTWYTAVPTMHQDILSRAASHAAAIRASRLRFIRSSSAALAPRVMENLAALFRAPVVEAYGMTEASHQMASNPLQAGRQKPGSVGLPAGPEMAVVDADGHRQPAGHIGEVVIRGRTVTRGYEDNPAANAEAFTDGWFHTGDQAYFDAEGYLFLTGRLKELINRGGEKIAPREIEEALLCHPGIDQAVAFAVPDDRLGEDVGAAVVPKPGAALEARDIREIVAGVLADFKIPRVVRILDTLPKGPTGKLQRIGLADVLGISSPAGPAVRAPSAPRTRTERDLARRWCELLNIPEIGVEDDFFLCGGDSLAATELLLHCSDLLGVDIPIVDFVERPTIRGMIAASERGRAIGAGMRRLLVPIQTAGTGRPIFILPGHDNNLWAASRMARHLGKQRPIFGFRAPMAERPQSRLSVEDIAEVAIAEIRRITPRGECALIGLCFGGLVAWEVARRLREPGVHLLVLIDCFNHGDRPGDASDAAVSWLTNTLQRVAMHRRHLQAMPARAERLAYLSQRVGYFWKHWRAWGRQWAFERALACHLPLPSSLRKVDYCNRLAARSYVPEPYDGHALLLRPSEPDTRRPTRRMGWNGLLNGPAHEARIACERHDLWRQPHVATMAREILAHLNDDADAESR
ncbi:MAG: AMP-binding protein [Candidatus Binatia bacterium]